jgi:hypothetical protein
MIFTTEEITIAWLALSSRERVNFGIGLPETFRPVMLSQNKRLHRQVAIVSVKLHEFLKAIKFDADGRATMRAIGQAWEACSRVDAESDDWDKEYQDAA